MSPASESQPRRPSRRRPQILIVAGSVLLVFALVVLVVPVSGDASEPEPGSDGSDWALLFGLVGAITGVGSLLLGIADFVRGSVRHSRARQARDADVEWREDGYL